MIDKDQVPAEKRGAILEAARGIFLASGIEGARMDDVAKRASIARPNLYRYFSSKDELVRLLVIDEVSATNRQRLEKMVISGPVGEILVESLVAGAARVQGDTLLAIAFTEGMSGVIADLISHDEDLLAAELDYWRPILAHGRARAEIADDLSDARIVRWFMTNHYFFAIRSVLFPNGPRSWVTDFVVPAVLAPGVRRSHLRTHESDQP